MSNVTSEYELLRQEILQYLEEFQSIRNMMYMITSAILTICLKGENTEPYAYLIPLLVILPSYLVYFDYWKDIIRDTTYLLVFYERNLNFPIKWESRLRYLNASHTVERNYHKTPYVTCAMICLILYFFHIDMKQKLRFAVGAIAVIITACIFTTHSSIDEKAFIRKWENIKANEKEKR